MTPPHDPNPERDNLLDFVDELGLLVEGEGWMPRIAGRALGWLLVASAPQSQADLCAGLQASAGAISSATRLLVSKGLVERVARPGDRRTYLRVSPSAWSVMERDGLRGVRRYIALASKAKDAIGDRPGIPVENLDRMADYFRIVETRMEAVIADLEQA